VKIHRISLGFGKPLLKYSRKNGVEWVWSMWPLGGYVQLLNTRITPVSAKDYKYSFDKKGRIKSVIEYTGKHKSGKTVFSYSKAPTTSKKYLYNYGINSTVGYLNDGMRAASCEGQVD
jgi:membrane-associated protease RseP (regulator of RpoE activity)